MMDVLFHFSSVLLLFILLFLSFRNGLVVVGLRMRIRRRWTDSAGASAGKPGLADARAVSQGRLPRLIKTMVRHLALTLEAVQWRAGVGRFIGGSMLLGLAGSWLGLLLFSTFKGMATCAVLLAIGPYIWATGKLIRQQTRARLEFLPAVEVFYQYYVLTGGKNVRNALREALEGNRIRYPVKPVFEQLYRNLTGSRDAEESFQLFVLALGHRWARYFANMMSAAFHEGIDMTRALEELIADLRNAQKAALIERNRLLEIRLANFSPLLFLIVFVAANFHLDFALAYQYYVLDPAGRNMLLDAVVLIIASFLMGMYLSIKKI